MSSLWDCEKCGYNHYEQASECKNCGTAVVMSEITVGSPWTNRSGFKAAVMRVTSTCIEYQMIGGAGFQVLTITDFLKEFSPADIVNHPPHYKDESGIECIEVTKHMQFCGGSCFMHLYEAGSKKNTIEDLKKAKWYAQKACELGENLNQEAREKIREVRRYRELGIYNAMRAICFSNWMLVIEWIDLEIARLEGEAADD